MEFAEEPLGVRKKDVDEFRIWLATWIVRISGEVCSWQFRNWLLCEGNVVTYTFIENFRREECTR